jgi:inosose dehydratase
MPYSPTANPASRLNRRAFLAQCTTGALALSMAPGSLQAAAKGQPMIPFGMSLYGMKSLDIDVALRTCAEIGYDSVEWVANSGWATEPKNLSGGERKRLAAMFDSLGLRLHGIMENLSLLAPPDTLRGNLDRLKDAAELAHALAPKRMPVIETTLGGKPAQWKESKDAMAERLNAWAEVGKSAKAVIAIKAHVGGALHTPEDAAWLVKQANSPWIKLTYDFSHFELRSYKLADSMALMIGQTRFIHIKDTNGGNAEKFQFILPGDGKTDYVEYLRLLKSHGYRDPVTIEVSGQVWNKKEYDPIVAAKHCYAKLAPAFEKAGVRDMKKAG